jgi:hypothetical protein
MAKPQSACHSRSVRWSPHRQRAGGDAGALASTRARRLARRRTDSALRALVSTTERAPRSLRTEDAKVLLEGVQVAGREDQAVAGSGTGATSRSASMSAPRVDAHDHPQSPKSPRCAAASNHECQPVGQPARRLDGQTDGHDGQPPDRAKRRPRAERPVRALRPGADDGIRTRDPHLGKELFNPPSSGRIACCNAGSPATPAALGTILGTKLAIAAIRSSASQRVSPSHHGSAGLLRTDAR